MAFQKALEHPYLAQFHDPAVERVCPRLFDFSFEGEFELINEESAGILMILLFFFATEAHDDMLALKHAVYQEVAQYHPESVPILDQLFDAARRQHANTSAQQHLPFAQQQQYQQQQQQNIQPQEEQIDNNQQSDDFFVPDF